jgi:hypothetical protein
MPNPITPNQPVALKQEYNPRWFIWTIVFLVITGISLVSYIVLSEGGTNDAPDFPKTKTQIEAKK